MNQTHFTLVLVLGVAVLYACTDEAKSLPQPDLSPQVDAEPGSLSGSGDGFMGDGEPPSDADVPPPANDAAPVPQRDAAAPADAAPIPQPDATAPAPDAGQTVDAAPVEDAAPAPEPDAAPCVRDCDDDGFDVDDGDCDDSNPLVYTGAEELCDGLDNNCDDVIDQIPEQCYEGPEGTLGVGACLPGRRVCVDGDFGACEDQTLPTPERCGNAEDDDCDGQADEGCDEDGDGFTVLGGDCDDGERDINPDAEEICDGEDNDCDEETDEVSEACYDGPAGTLDVGQCQGGVRTCQNAGACTGQIQPQVEACDNELDEDCDGEIDEGCEAEACPDLNLDSPVTVTGSCLTAGSSGQALVTVVLTDSEGNAVVDADVQIGAQPAPGDAWGPLQRSGRTYGRVLTAPAAAGELTITVTVGCADGGRVALRQTPVVRVVPELADGDDLSTGGCDGLDGNLRVRVIDGETGLPLDGAWMMAGDRSRATLLQNVERAFASQAGQGTNVTRTDADGIARLTDFGDVLEGPMLVTAGADGYENVTLVGLNASSANIPLFPSQPPEPPLATLRGDLIQFDDLGRDGEADMGLVTPSFDLPFLSTLVLPRLMSRFDCWDPVRRGLAGNLVPEVAVPGNLHVPQQGERLFGFPVTVEQHAFAIDSVPHGRDNYVALAGKVPVDDIVGLLGGGADDVSALVSLLTPRELGVLRNHAVDGDQENLEIPLTSALAENARCEVQNPPENTGLFCVSAGDWSGGNGNGRLFPMGLATMRPDDVDAGRNGAIRLDVTTVPAEGLFAEIGYLGVAVALYLDPDRAPNGKASAVSAVMDRTNLGPRGGQMRQSGFFDTTPLVRADFDFAWDQVGREDSPPVNACRIDVVRTIRQAYDPGRCSEDRLSSYERPVWRAYVAGDPGELTLPRVPAAWPNGNRAGFVDPNQTPERDLLSMRITCYGLGLADAFDFNAANFRSLVEDVTHISSNTVSF